MKCSLQFSRNVASFFKKRNSVRTFIQFWSMRTAMQVTYPMFMYFIHASSKKKLWVETLVAKTELVVLIKIDCVYQ